MKKTTVKIIAPLICTVILVVYFIYIISISLSTDLSPAGTIIAVVIPLGLAGVSVYVFVERIIEIRSGDEDDLSQY